jgi:D-sedoheptulose 7-phosphate isomerase
MAGRICTRARDYLANLGQLVESINSDAVELAVDRIFEAWQQGRHVFVFGNGGSAYAASHYVTDLVKTAAVDGRPRLKAMSLVDNYGLTTAIGNDVTYDEIFQYPLQTYATPGDVAIAISASGNSPNVLKACRWAGEHGLTVIGVTGFAGGKLAGLCRVHIHIPSDNYGLVEDLQLAVGHMLSQALKSRVSAQEAP